MPHFNEELRVELAGAVRQAAAELRSHESELFGFALCTDDDVRTIYHIACTRDWVRENEVGSLPGLQTRTMRAIRIGRRRETEDSVS